MLTEPAQFEQTANLVLVTIRAHQLSAPQMQDLVGELMSRMRNDNAQHFVLDMAEVEFVSSECLGALVSFLQDLEHVRGRIALAGCRPNVQFLFKVTRLESVFSLCDDIEEGKAAVVGREAR